MESPILLLTSDHLSIEMYSSYSNKLQITLQQKHIRKHQSFCWKIGYKSGIIRHIATAYRRVEGRNRDAKTKIDYRSRLPLCGEDDSDTGTFHFL